MASSNPDHWAYFHESTFSDPVYSSNLLIRDQSNTKRPVALHANNIRPQGGFAAALANAPSGGETKIIYTIRHGNTLHNEDSESWGKEVSWEYLASLGKNFDPKITDVGEVNAATAAQQLVSLRDNEAAPLPVTVYSSPLRRCVETSIHMIKRAGLGQPRHDGVYSPVTLYIKEGLREWMGWDHEHNSDCHGSRADIETLVDHLQAQLGTNVPYQIDVPEDVSLRNETYTDVDRRVRGVLNDIFDDPGSGPCVMLVLHGRSNKSFLRVLGHPPAATANFEMANCAVLSYRVTRHRLDPHQAAQRALTERAQWDADLAEAERSKQAIRDHAVAQVRAWKADGHPKLISLREFLQLHEESGDEAARVAGEKLRSDLGELQGW